MKQQCHVSFVYGSWVFTACGIIFYLFRGYYVQAALWLLFIPLFLWLYVRYFPSISQYMGYGSVEDRPASQVTRTAVKVKLYTGLGCPFCPIVKRRLKELQSRMAFELREVDITFKPELLVSTGIRALPVVEIGEARWVGNGTSQQLAQFISEHAASVS
jgi:glutaredoxin